MPDISSSLSKREVNARQNTYTKSEIDLKDGAIQAIAEAAQTTADAAEKKNQKQDQLIAELQRSSHSHSNQAVLDKTEQPYTTAERDKLAGLENYTHPTHTANAKGFYKFANDGLGHVSDADNVTKQDIVDLGIPGQDTTYTAGTGISISGTTINHKNSVAAKTTAGFLKLKYDSQGHITGSSGVTKDDIVDLGIPGSIPIYNVDVDEEYGYSEGMIIATIVVNQTAHPIGVPIIGKNENADYGLMSAKDKTKLDNIADSANNYVHPTTSGNKHIPSGGSSGQILRWSADGTAVWGADNNTTYSDATQSTHGLMTAADKKKLDGMDLSKYLPLAGGVMTGNIDMQANQKEILVGAHRSGSGYATPACGGILESPGVMTDTLKSHRSFIGSYRNTVTGAFYNLISVRHRNGFSDGDQFGMYLYSVLTSADSLRWNKQIAANVWQGDRILLDSANFTDYAAPLSHTHKNIDSIGNVGYYGSDAASTNGWYKFHSGTLTGYNDRTARLMLTYMYGYNNFGTIFFHARCNNGNTIKIQRLLWEVRSGFEDGDVVAVAKGNDYSLYVYNRNPQWGRIKIRVLESGGTSSAWDMTLASNFTKESTAPTPTIVASDGCTVANATTWNGLINDVDTYNSSDTWILVKKDNRIQHRYAGELDVNSAKTLVDSGWQKPTFPSGVKSSSIRYRKQGKIVSVTGYVQFSTAQTTITVFTLPTGYRPPAKIQQFNAVDSSAQASFLTKIDTDGKVGFFGKTQGFFTTATEYYMHCTFFVD